MDGRTDGNGSGPDSMAEAIGRAALAAGRYRAKLERLERRAREKARQLDRAAKRTEKREIRTGSAPAWGGAR